MMSGWMWLASETVAVLMMVWIVWNVWATTEYLFRVPQWRLQIPEAGAPTLLAWCFLALLYARFLARLYILYLLQEYLRCR